MLLNKKIVASSLKKIQFHKRCLLILGAIIITGAQAQAAAPNIKTFQIQMSEADAQLFKVPNGKFDVVSSVCDKDVVNPSNDTKSYPCEKWEVRGDGFTDAPRFDHNFAEEGGDPNNDITATFKINRVNVTIHAPKAIEGRLTDCNTVQHQGADVGQMGGSVVCYSESKSPYADLTLSTGSGNILPEGSHLKATATEWFLIIPLK